MKAPRKKVILFTILGCFVMFLLLKSPLFPWLSFKNLEWQVKRNIDPTELQQWATHLLAQFDNYQDFNGTNMPPGLKKVKGFGHDVEIHKGWRQGNVIVFGRTKDGPSLEVGPPTSVNTNFVPWKPGIYFMGQASLW
ncbi:MAG: hypothetical protein ABIQ35_15345 [Verrucomicrobiota bacterium]